MRLENLLEEWLPWLRFQFFKLLKFLLFEIVKSLNVGEWIKGVFLITSPLNEFAFTISSYDGFIGDVAQFLRYLS